MQKTIPPFTDWDQVANELCEKALISTRLGWQRFGGRGTILEVQQVTLSELHHAIGYGAMFCAVLLPVQVWPRHRRRKK